MRFAFCRPNYLKFLENISGKGNNMFKVIVVKYVWDSDEIETSKKHALFHREISLPFPPFIGLELIDEDDNFFWQSGSILKVTWWNNHKGGQRFVCSVKDDFPYWRDGCDFSFDWFVKERLESGWTLIKIDNEDEEKSGEQTALSKPIISPSTTWPFPSPETIAK